MSRIFPQTNPPAARVGLVEIGQAVHILHVHEFEDIVYARHYFHVGFLRVHRAREVLVVAILVEVAGEVEQAAVASIARKERIIAVGQRSLVCLSRTGA